MWLVLRIGHDKRELNRLGFNSLLSFLVAGVYGPVFILLLAGFVALRVVWIIVCGDEGQNFYTVFILCETVIIGVLVPVCLLIPPHCYEDVADHGAIFVDGLGTTWRWLVHVFSPCRSNIFVQIF